MSVPSFMKRPMKPESELTSQQKRCLTIASSTNENIFVGGGIGTGKTETMLHLFRALSGAEIDGSVEPVNGVLLLSAGQWINAVYGEGSALMNKMRLPASTMYPGYAANPPMAVKKAVAQSGVLDGVHTLMIDDLEQIDYNQFRCLRQSIYALFRLASKPDLPFGTLRVIAAGDFCLTEQQEHPEGRNFAFECPQWDSCFPVQCELEGSDGAGASFCHEPAFAKLLARLRLGSLTEIDSVFLETREVDVNSRESGMSESFREPCSTSMYERGKYEDPLKGRLLPMCNYLYQSNYGRVESNSGTDGITKPMYRMSLVKSGMIPAGECRAYEINIGVLTLSRDIDLPLEIRQILVGKMEVTIARKIYSAPVGRPCWSSEDATAHASVQVFSLHEDVILGYSFPEDNLPAGSAGTITELHDDSVTVRFTNGVRKRLYRTACSGVIKIGEMGLLKFTPSPQIMDVTATLTAHYLPISHRKIVPAAAVYTSPFINGYLAAADVPRIVVDLNLLEYIGVWHPLYSMLAFAPSFEHVELVRGTVRSETSNHSRSNLVYTPAADFHTALKDPSCVSEMECAVCGQKLGEECMMSQTDAFVKTATPLQKMRYCRANFQRCPVDNKVMTHSDMIDHRRLTEIVKCECGELVMMRDIAVCDDFPHICSPSPLSSFFCPTHFPTQEHREKYLDPKGSSSCVGPAAKRRTYTISDGHFSESQAEKARAEKAQELPAQES